MKTHLSLIYLLLLSIQVNSQTDKITNPESVGVSTRQLNEMNNQFHKIVDEGQLAGIQTAIIRKGKLVHFNTYGFANIEERKELDEKSIFRIFSMTKPITSVGLMQLYEKGKFKLDDPVYKYIPEFKNMLVHTENGNISVKNPIKIIDLLRHTSGISYGRSPNSSVNKMYEDANLNNSENLKIFISKLSKIPLLFEPGTDWKYGFSTDVCGYLIEVLSGKKLDDYLYENVLKPLGMMDTHFQLPKSKIDRFTTGYSTKNEKLVVVEHPSESRFIKEVTFLKGGGGLVSTTNDYIKFCQMLMNEGNLNGNRILKPETIRLMIKDHLSDVRKHTERLKLLPGETGFGLGFSIANHHNKIVYGWGGAVGTYFRIDPQNELAYILMIQLSPYRQLDLRSKFQQLVNNSLVDNINLNKENKDPVLLDKSIISGIGLEKINLKDQPNRAFFQKTLYQGSDISVYMISSETATKSFESFPIDEFVCLMNGKAKLEPKNEDAYQFNTGDFIVVEKGFKGTWQTIGGNKYHLELSVVSNKRSGQKNSSKAKDPFKIDENLISGTHLKENKSGPYKSTVLSGTELEITLESEKAKNVQIKNSEKEQFIHILSGMVTITSNEGSQQTFYTGDFFIIPKGFNGSWQSHGHNLFRMLKVVSK